IDFEDGYGNRPDEVEDAEAVRCAEAVADGAEAGTLPPFVGIRIKTLSNELAPRALRTLDLFLTTLAARVVGRPTSIADEPGVEAGTTTHAEPHLHHSTSPLPANFVVTVPKVVHAGQVAAVDAALVRIERATGLPIGSTQLELMVETPQSIIGDDGACPLPAFVDAGNGRVRGAHFGTYDYTALVGVTASQQHMNHPATGFARHVMQVSLAQRGLLLSDGATNVMPVGPHRAAAGSVLTGEQVLENRDVVRRAWRLYQKHVRTSLERGLYQGWDLHPAQLPSRFAATYAFYRQGLPAAAARLRNYVLRTEGGVLDEPATARALAAFVLRGVQCGAVDAEDVQALAGVGIAQLTVLAHPRLAQPASHNDPLPVAGERP
ncbi:MAG: aldolase, partial [Arthrobacter sp.]|nr:aldolase [Arthrobacter sp.]